MYQIDPPYCRDTTFVALFTIVKKWKQPKYSSTGEWIMKMWCIYTMEFYSSVRKDGIMFAGKWMELKSVILSEVTQTQKSGQHMFSLT